MTGDGDPLALSRHLAARLTPVAVVIAAFIGIATPAIYYALQSRASSRAAAIHAEEIAEKVSGVVLTSRALWKYEDVKIHTALERFARPEATAVRVFDESGREIAEFRQSAPERKAWWNHLASSGSAPLVFNNRRIGTVQVELSQGTLPARTIGLLVVAVVLGSALAVVISVYPVRVVRRAEQRIQDLVEAVRVSNVELAKTAAENAEVARENERLYTEAQARVHRVRKLAELSQLVNSSLDVNEVLQFVADATVELIDGDLSRVWVADDAEGLTLAAWRSRGGEMPPAGQAPLRRGEGIVGWAIEHRTTWASSNVFDEPRFVNKTWARAAGYVSLIVVPLCIGDRCLGALAVLTRVSRCFSTEDRELLEIFAAKAALALEHARLYRDAQQKQQSLAGLVDVSQRLTRGLDLEAVLDAILEATAQVFGGDAGLRLLDGDVLVRAGATPGALKAMVRERIHVGESLSGRVAATGEPIIVPNARDDPRVIEGHGAPIALMCVPVRAGARMLGTLHVYREQGHRFDAEALDVATSLANQAAIAIENARLYEDAQRALRDAAAKNAELDSFVYSVSHDLKAPLVAVQGMAGALVEDYSPALGAPGLHYLARLQANVEQMERLIADLLTLSRVGRESRPPEQVSLAEVVDEVLVEWGAAIRTHGIKVIADELGTITAVRTQAEQVMANLIGNAVKYVGHTPSPTIEIATVDRGDALECSVKDNGIGIAPAYHEKIFEIFQRLNEVEAEGTGVGLAIVKRIVEAAGGRIWVESEKGRGATFRFTWPKEPLRGGRRA